MMLIVIVIILFILKDNNKNNINNPNKPTISENEKEYYEDMIKTMHAYYLIYYKNLALPEDKKNSTIKITLEYLENYGFPIDKFVNYETKEKCDKDLSFATRTVEDNKYVVRVYYKCGNDSNYKE